MARACSRDQNRVDGQRENEMSNMTPQQSAAATSTAKNIACIASAGSGKTRVLTERAAHLVSNGVSAEDVLLVTFTRKAAREIRDRLIELVGDEARSMWIDTFHGIGLRIIKHVHGSTPSVLAPDDCKAIFESVCEDLKVKGDHRSLFKLQLESRNTLEYGLADTISSRANTAIKEYGRRMVRIGAIDYDGIMHAALSFFEQCKLAFRHVLVDEAQDCDAVQWRLVELLKDRSESLFVVGDPNQTIYEWRGASGSYMTEFAKRAETHTLNTTFRCGQKIVDSARKLIVANPRGIESAVKISHDPDRKGVHVSLFDRKESGIASALPLVIGDLLGDKCGSDTAFLCRTNLIADGVTSTLRDFGWKVHRAGRMARRSQEPEFRIAWATLALAVNTGNDAAFATLCNYGAVRIDSRPGSLRGFAAQQGVSLWDAWLEVEQKQTKLRRLVEKALPGKFANEALVALPKLPRELLYMVHPHASLEELLTGVELIDASDGAEQGADECYVGTIHGAKGLEWDRVVVVGVEDGQFPPDRVNVDIEAERRLMYVAMTRARSELIIHYEENPSRFVGEIFGEENEIATQ